MTFGTGKLGDLAAFASAIVLAMIALLIGYESIDRLIDPVPIAFDQAIPIAVLGSASISSAPSCCATATSIITARPRCHDHHHVHDHSVHRDHNLRAAFVHVVADAAVSVLVIVGLVVGRQFGWLWMDPVMGLIATVVILSWSWTLVRSAGAVLLDVSPDLVLSSNIAARLEHSGDRISDLHLWRVGPGHLAAVISLVSDHPNSPGFYKDKLAGLPGLSHVTIEVECCPGAHPRLKRVAAGLGGEPAAREPGLGTGRGGDVTGDA